MTPIRRSARPAPGRPRRGRVLAALVLALCVAAPVAADDDRPSELEYDTPGPFPTLSPEYGRTAGPEVRIEDHDLTPRTAIVTQGQQVSWRSASQSASRIVFEREVARSMVCHGLVNFVVSEDELRSGPLYTGDRASFCELAPGRYRYRVVRWGHGDGQGVQASRRLEGWIVVHPRPLAQVGR